MPRTQDWYCYTVCDRVTISVGGYSTTQFYCDDYCDYVGNWQIPLPPEGGGDGTFLFDLGSVSGGGVSGAWTTGFPSNPNHGDIFELRDPLGVVTVYIWDSSINTWVIVCVNVPVVIISADRFSFLANIPSDFIITGSDNFVYRYNETLASWVGRPAEIDPCIQAKFLQQNQEFKNKMQDLKSKTTLNYEAGYIMTKNSDGSYSYTYIQGDAGSPEIAFSVQSPMAGYIHSHYTGTFSIFSGQDVKAIYDLYMANKIENPGSFTAGVVTSQGTTYIMVIENLTDFLNFSQQNFSSTPAFQSFESYYHNWFTAYSTLLGHDTVTARELAFLKALEGSGIAVFKGTSTFDSWSRIKNQNNQVTTTNCN